MIRLRYVIILAFFLPSFGFGQSLVDFNTERLALDKNLMTGLGSWVAANMAVSGYGWATTDNEAKYFHQMNVLWNGVNLALVIPGYFSAKRSDPTQFSFAQTWKAQLRTEKIFLFNTALDLFYVTGGFYLKQRALTDTQNYHRYRGWGNSLVLQGGFLFLFDMTAAFLHSKHRQKKLDGFLNQVQLSDNGLGLKLTLGQKQTIEPGIHF